MPDEAPVQNEASLKEAGIRAFEIMTSVLEEHEDVYVSLACTGRLLAHGAPAVVAEIAKVVEEWKTKPKEEMMELVDLLPVNAFVALARIEPTEAFKKVERQVSISALVTAHAFFESVIKDLLRVTILCNPQMWIETVKDRNVVIGDALEKGLQHCTHELFQKELNRLSLAGVPALTARLLCFCKGNVTTKSHFQNYTLDMERLKKLDQLRHDYAHRRTKDHYSIRQVDTDLRYLTITAVHLITCIMEAYDLKGQHRRKPETEKA
jgi:hypothetical protein